MGINGLREYDPHARARAYTHTYTRM